ncbi:uncharacterized protein [Osmerus mordax]
MDACVQKMVPVILRVVMLCSCLGPLLLNLTPLWHVSANTICSSSASACCNTSCPQGEVNLTSPSFDVTEGDDITMECEHNLPLTGLEYEWRENNITMTDQSNNTLTLKRLLAPLTRNYSCSVISRCCGTHTSMTKTVVVKDNSMVILVLCAVLAVVFILAVGVSMKFFLKRENVKRKARMEMRNQQFNRGI